jgi:hypothetical protein
MPAVVRSFICMLWLLVLVPLGAACTRATVASFVPVLDVGVRLRRSGDHAQRAAEREAQAYTTELYLWLSFRPLSPAASLPLWSDASGLLLQAPCEENDTACLDETSESEPELAAVREDVP